MVALLFKYGKWLDSSVWPIDGTLTGITTPSQSGSGINSNEGVLHIWQISRTGSSSPDAFQCYTKDTHFIWPIDGTLTSTTTQDQSGPGSNGNERVLYITQSSRIGASPSYAVQCHTQDTHWGGSLTPLRGGDWYILQLQLTGQAN